MKLKIIAIGKIKEKIYQKRILEYIKWINKDIQSELIILKDRNEKNLEKNLKKYLYTGDSKICISQEGIKYSSKQFSNLLFKENEDLIFFIGGPNGFPKIVRKNVKNIVSLSNLTMPHEMALLVLSEQIFRALEIKKGSKYHR
tara:strand:+ start:201 stop:629 length:429 start_codon:yes stop_codon:yes gene_type:complete